MERLIQRFMQYVQIDSESGHEGRFCAFLEGELDRLKLAYHRDNAGAAIGSDGYNIYSKLEGEGEPLLICCHMDTVAPGVGVKPQIVGEYIRSDGETVLGADDKSAIAITMELVESLTESGIRHRPIELLFTISEEPGLLGAAQADFGVFAAKEGIIMDSFEYGSIINHAPAHIRLRYSVFGKAAHAGFAPEQGRHAIKTAARAIDNIPCGRVDADTVVNVGSFTANGVTNVVPANAVFEMEVRSFSRGLLEERVRDATEQLRLACEAFGTSFGVEVTNDSDGLYVPADSDFYKRLSALYEKLGERVVPARTYSGSDGTWLFKNGINVLNISTGMHNAHDVSEELSIPQFLLTYKLMLMLCTGADI